PGIQGKGLSRSGRSDLLDEAFHGLAYLQKTLVDDSTFVVEVGDGLDHDQGPRLPESDGLDGKRPALSALSPMPMGTTGAALALGSRVFARLGDTVFARRCEQVARKIFQIVSKPGATRETAYWKDGVNDFYRDDNAYDNLALLAAELHGLSGEAVFLQAAKSWSDSAGVPWSASWPDVGLHAAIRLSAIHDSAVAQTKTSLAGGAAWAATNAPLWGIPEAPTWCPILGWSAFGAEAVASARTISDTSWTKIGWDVFDYVLGRNNWGLSFFMSPNIRSSVANIYNPIYALNDEFPTGAIAEGPGSKTIHDELSQWFSIGPDEPTEPFNTSTTVFYDNARDFQTMETVIGEQATFLFLLAELTRSVGDT
ncbi:MAG: glycoside hydrolase family 9 protein, partial [Fibrobacterota bacterium]